MDDRSLQLLLFLGIAAALLVLVIVGFEVAHRARALWRQRRSQRDAMAIKQKTH